MILQIITIIFFAICIIFFTKQKKSQDRFSQYKEISDSFDSSFGKMSYIDSGEGFPILSIHGICGGYDQAYDTLNGFYDECRVIAPSRFGYPGTDLPKDATIDMQVDAYIELLDHLNIEKTFVLATSAGSTSAIRFALTHPERTLGLVLYCSGYPNWEEPEKEVSYAGPPSAFCNDFMMFLISPLFKPIMGMDQSTLLSIMPMKERKDGIIFDGKITNTIMINDYKEYDLGKLQVPTLIVHSSDDKLASFDKVEYWASRIPNCTFIPLEDGGHLMSGHEGEIFNTMQNWYRFLIVGDYDKCFE